LFFSIEMLEISYAESSLADVASCTDPAASSLSAVCSRNHFLHVSITVQGDSVYSVMSVVSVWDMFILLHDCGDSMTFCREKFSKTDLLLFVPMLRNRRGSQCFFSLFFFWMLGCLFFLVITRKSSSKFSSYSVSFIGGVSVLKHQK
jgi:hypothetical protein